MIKIDKIVINKIFEDNELGNSRLEFNIKGSNINYVIVNTIRRTIFSDIPIYAFNDFKFDKNSSIFHNNYLKLRLSHLPIWMIENTIDYIDYNKSNKTNIILYNDDDDDDDNENENENVTENKKNESNTIFSSSSLKQLTMYINYKNKTNDIITVTTNDAKFYYEEKQIVSPYKIYIPIVKLQPNQEISFSAIANIGTEQENTIYSAVSIVTYKEITSNEFNFILESRGQITEKRILLVAIFNIENKLKNLIQLLNESEQNKNHTSGMLVIPNEDHTLGNLITRGLQQHDDISFAGYNLPHPLAKKLIFNYSIKKDSNNSINNIIQDVINYYCELFNKIKNEINKKL